MSWITMKEQSAQPETPSSGYATLYVDDNGNFSFKLDDGTVRTVSSTYTQINSNTSHATTSNSYQSINDMSINLTAGTYALWFSATGTQTGNGFLAQISVFINGVQQTASERDFHNITSHSHDITTPLHAIFSFSINSTQTVDIRFKTSGGTFTIGKRSLIIHKGG